MNELNEFCVIDVPTTIQARI